MYWCTSKNLKREKTFNGGWIGKAIYTVLSRDDVVVKKRKLFIYQKIYIISLVYIFFQNKRTKPRNALSRVQREFYCVTISILLLLFITNLLPWSLRRPIRRYNTKAGGTRRIPAQIMDNRHAGGQFSFARAVNNKSSFRSSFVVGFSLSDRRTMCARVYEYNNIIYGIYKNLDNIRFEKNKTKTK